MPRRAIVYRILVASHSDVIDDREAIIEVIHAWNAANSYYQGAYLEPVLWETLATPEFQNWVADKPYRQRLAEQADAWDLDAAGDLFGMYNGERQPTDHGNAQREQQLRDATLESSTAAPATFEDNYSRSKLMSLRIIAKAGDEQAKDYLRTNGRDIQRAYAENRIVD